MMRLYFLLNHNYKNYTIFFYRTDDKFSTVDGMI